MFKKRKPKGDDEKYKHSQLFGHVSKQNELMGLGSDSISLTSYSSNPDLSKFNLHARFSHSQPSTTTPVSPKEASQVCVQLVPEGSGTSISAEESDQSLFILLHLAAIEPAVETPLRILTIQKNCNNRFGVIIRQEFTFFRNFAEDGTYIEFSRQVIIAEPKDICGSTGLLPGDQLIRIENLDITEDIRSSDIEKLISQLNKEVTLYVRQLVELSECSMQLLDRAKSSKLSSDDKEKPLVPKYRENGDHGNGHDRQGRPQSWGHGDGDRVWLFYKEVYTGARLVERCSEKGWCRIVLDYDGEEINVEEDNIEMANPVEFDRCENLVKLRFVNESSVLHVLRQRYGSNLIHTYAGPCLVVVNPMAPLSIYTEKVMEMFRGGRQLDMPPHVFATAQMALQALQTTRQSQVICLLGRSGAGKSTTDRHIINYILQTAGSGCQRTRSATMDSATSFFNRPTAKVTVEKLHACWSLLDSFTCARTLGNTRASRCARLTTLELAEGCSHPVTGLHIQIFLLERSRIVRRPEGEPAFHVFYQMLAGLENSQRREFFLENLEETNLFMTPLQRAEDKKAGKEAWDHVVLSATLLGISPAEWNSICRVLAAIYHLGVAGATSVQTGASGEPGNTFARFQRPGSAQKAATLLGLSLDHLNHFVFDANVASLQTEEFGMGTGRPGAAGRPRTASDVPSRMEGDLTSQELLEGCVTGLYMELMQIVVYLVDRSMSSGQQSVHTISVLDPPGFQNTASCGRSTGATFEDLCYNYANERLNLLSHDLNLTTQRAKYEQENINADWFDDIDSSPAEVVSLMDRNPQTSSSRQLGLSREHGEQKGLLWILDEEALTGREETFVKRMYSLYHQHKINVKDRDRRVLRRVGRQGNFIISHNLGATRVQYNPVGWLKNCREYPTSRNAQILLENSRIETLTDLVLAASTAGQTVRRGARLSGPNLFRQKSVSSQVKLQMDFLVDLLRRTGKVHFIYCLLPVVNAGLCELQESPLAPQTDPSHGRGLNAVLLREQIRGLQLLDSIRCHKRGYADHLVFRDFRRRFQGLLEPSERPVSPLVDEREAVEGILDKLHLESSTYKIGISQIFFRVGVLNQLDDQRNELFNDKIANFQAACRGYLSRKKVERLKLEHTAIRCIQRNSSIYLSIRDWPWMKLFCLIQPVVAAQLGMNPSRGAAHVSGEWKSRAETLESERNDYKAECFRLETKLEDLTNDVRNEQVTTVKTEDLLELEREERIKLERELDDVRVRLATVERNKTEIEYDMNQAKAWQQDQLRRLQDRDSDEENASADVEVYRQRYRSAMQQVELLKLQVDHRQSFLDDEQVDERKVLEMKMSDLQTDNEQLRTELSAYKRRLVKSQNELSDLRLQWEAGEARYGELERRQKRLDVEAVRLHNQHEESLAAGEKLQRERDEAVASRFRLDRELQEAHSALTIQTEKSARLSGQITELSSLTGGGSESEVLSLRISRMELEQRVAELEDEADDLASRLEDAEQSKVRSEMTTEKLKQQAIRDNEAREADLEAIRSTSQRRQRQLESQLEEERQDRQRLISEKREADRQVSELLAREPQRDKDLERKLKKELKKTKAILQETQILLDQYKNHTPDDKVALKDLRDQLDECELHREAATRSKRAMDHEIEELHQQIEELSRAKQEADDRCMNANRERLEVQTQLEDKEEEGSELLRKYKALNTRKTSETSELVARSRELSVALEDLEKTRRDLSECQARLESMESEQVGRGAVLKLETRIRELEGRLDLEMSGKGRLQAQLDRIKEQMDHVQEDRDMLSASETTEKDRVRRLQRQLRESQEEIEEVRGRLQEAERRRVDMTTKVEQFEEDYAASQNDLKLALKRVNDLQTMLDEDMRDDSSEQDEDERATSLLNKATEVLRRRPGAQMPSPNDSANLSFYSLAPASSPSPVRGLNDSPRMGRSLPPLPPNAVTFDKSGPGKHSEKKEKSQRPDVDSSASDSDSDIDLGVRSTSYIHNRNEDTKL